MKSYRDLIAWQKAMAMVTEIYRLTSAFPSEEKFGLTSQLRRAAVSVPSNIAEGHSRNSDGEFKQFLGIARGSISEVETQLLIAVNLGFLSEQDSNIASVEEVGRITSGLIRSLKSKS